MQFCRHVLDRRVELALQRLDLLLRPVAGRLDDADAGRVHVHEALAGALAAGVPPEKIMFSGIGKTADELALRGKPGAALQLAAQDQAADVRDGLSEPGVDLWTAGGDP